MKLLKYIVIFIFIIFMVSIAFFVGNYIFDSLSREAITLARKQASAFGVHVGKIRYERPWKFSIRSLTWNQVNVHFRIDGEEKLFDRPEEQLAIARTNEKLPLEHTQFEILVDDITMRLVDFSSKKVVLTASNFSITPVSNTGLSNKLKVGSVEGEIFETVMTINMQDPLQSSRFMVKRLIKLAKTGSTDARIKFYGTAKMNIRGSMVKARINMVDRGGQTVVVVNKHDIEKISHLFDDKLTSAEITIIAENPAKVPLLLSIKDYAEKKSKDAFVKDRTVPRDPFRHVLWSYLLTKEFGPEFAEKVTDAHEEGATGNTPMERRQDYNNNAVGRRYVREGVQESEILQLVRTDPAVMRGWNRGSRFR